MIKARSRKTKGWILKPLVIFSLFLTSSAILVSCGTTANIRDVNLSYNAVKTVVQKNIPQGVRSESPNGREITSNYFEMVTFKSENPKAVERAYAVVKILGATRPYNIDVKVFVEAKDDGYWVADGSDSKMTKQLGERMKQALADRREDRNVIDDFRAF